MSQKQLADRIYEIVQNKKEKVAGWLKFDVPVAGQIDLKDGRIFVDHIGLGSLVECDSYTLGESSISFHTRCNKYTEQLSKSESGIRNPIQCASVPTTSDIVGLFDVSIKLGAPVWDVLISEYGLTIYGPNDRLTRQLPEWTNVYLTEKDEELMAKHIQRNMSGIVYQLQNEQEPVNHPEYYENVVERGVGFDIKYINCNFQ
jgi:hypothetical protein